MAATVEYFGIRHHGPGSARRLLEALDALKPVEVLIEGPSDLSELIPMLADQKMIPPVALLAYPMGEPENSIFWPFSIFSPEYQAVVWAVSHRVPVRFIDLPVYWLFKQTKTQAEKQQLPGDLQAPDQPDRDDDDELATVEKNEDSAESTVESTNQRIVRDPIGVLASAAGYKDGESWWQQVIEENPAPGPIFAAVADAMRALRENLPPPRPHEAAREAHMRLEIAKSRKQAEGAIAVVCGAWHVPALTEKHSSKDDRELLKGPVKRKISATWTPWTSPRLAFESGYSAGVAYPGWNRHLWQTPLHEQVTRWIARTAQSLREKGHVISTASLIETERLAVSLAAIRGRPMVGFDELIDATVACICFGNQIIWDSVADELLIGSEVGSIPDGVPLAPLLEDLQRQQKAARLKPEAFQRELLLDLRTESGLFRSTLLHRLAILNVPWGRLDDPGRSRGTFRERWLLQWEAEFAVDLVENLIYGATIEQAATGRIIAELPQTTKLGDLSNLVFQALTAQLPGAAAQASTSLEHRAGQATDCQEMLSALPAMADALRYGKAREFDTSQMATLFDRIALQAVIALRYAARGLDDEAATILRVSIRQADRSIRLIDSPSLNRWNDSLAELIDDDQATPIIAGQAARLLYETDQLPSESAVALLARRLSPGTTIAAAAGFIEGFLDGAGDRLIHDSALRDCVSDWVMSLDETGFIESLPLFRRVFSSLDKMERKRLLSAALGKKSQNSGFVLIDQFEKSWPEQMQRILKILNGEPFHE
jgi:hypothetical protein